MTQVETPKSVIENRFAALLEEPIWVCWSEIIRADRKVKLPINPLTGKSASVAQPSTWTSYKRAIRLRRKTGLGIVLTPTKSGRLVGIDLDSCRNRQTGAIDDWATTVVSDVSSYAEVSPSGTGLKIFALMTDDEWSKARLLLNSGANRLGASWKAAGDNHPSGIEFYLGARYFTVTGADYGRRPLAHIECKGLAHVVGLAEARFGRRSLPAKVPHGTRERGNDRSESARAFRACLAAVRAGIAMDVVPAWAARRYESDGREDFRVSEAYWVRLRNDGTQLLRDYTRAEEFIKRRRQ